MQRFLLTLAVLAVLVVGCPVSASAQPAAPDSPRGTNYDPPPPVKPKEEPPQPEPAPEANTPSLSIQNLDWTDKSTWLKLALLVGSILLARRAFRQMKDDY